MSYIMPAPCPPSTMAVYGISEAAFKSSLSNELRHMLVPVYIAKNTSRDIPEYDTVARISYYPFNEGQIGVVVSYLVPLIPQTFQQDLCVVFPNYHLYSFSGSYEATPISKYSMAPECIDAMMRI